MSTDEKPAVETIEDDDVSDEDYIIYSNRAAANLKEGKFSKAAADAEKCIQLSKGSFLKGYTHKAAALIALHRYKEATECVTWGLTKFPNDPTLEKQMATIHKQRSAGRERARSNIVQTQTAKAQKSREAESMSDFVVIAKAEMELQILALQMQLKMVNELASMSDDEKRHLLFGMLDQDGSGKISARELADAVRRRNDSLSFAEGLEKAIELVAVFDQDGDAQLDEAEFKTFLDTMLAQNHGTTFHELSEFLILQLMFSEGGNTMEEDFVADLASPAIDEAVKERSKFFDAATDVRMMALFRLFDIDGDGTISFPEVALGLYKFLNSSMEDSTKSAIELLIMVEKDDSRELDYEGFTRLILNFCAIGGAEFDEVADGLTLLMCQPTVVTGEDLEELMVADEMYNMVKDLEDAAQEGMEVMDALSYGKMHKLFDLWDENHDGALDYGELLKGMRKYQSAKGMDMDESVDRATITMLAFDEDGNQKLDKEEFALALTKFAKRLDVDLHDFIDFLIVISTMGEDDPMEAAYMSAIAPLATAEIKHLQDLEAGGLLELN